MHPRDEGNYRIAEVRPIRAFSVIPPLPVPIEALRTSAYNLRSSWSRDSIELLVAQDFFTTNPRGLTRIDVPDSCPFAACLPYLEEQMRIYSRFLSPLAAAALRDAELHRGFI
jgi:hypothetical protein